jgi:hypothetical protein
MGRTRRVKPHSQHVDGDVVVVPTKQGEIVRVVVASVVAFFDVVGLQSVAAVATVDGACSLIPLPHKGSDRWRDGFAQV